jgi:ribosomal protein L37AE/L43A
MSETVYWVDGRCHSCGSRGIDRRNVRVAHCAGCGREIGTSLWTGAISRPVDQAEQRPERDA